MSLWYLSMCCVDELGAYRVSSGNWRTLSTLKVGICTFKVAILHFLLFWQVFLMLLSGSCIEMFVRCVIF